MVEFMVFLRNTDGSLKGMGRHSFRVAPRTGEYVTVARAKGVQGFKIKAVVHPLEPASSAGQLVVESADVDQDSGCPVL